MGLLIGCSTKKNTSGTRAYHALTARYNVFFNAQQAYDEAMSTRYASHRDNFSGMLPIYLADTTQNKKTGGPFDLVIEKTMKAIREHSVSAKPRRDSGQKMTPEYREWLRQEEFNPFLKNAWLLMGKAQVQNSDYTDAVSTFSQILRMFPNEEELISETQLWMIRAYAAMEWFYDAENLIYTLKTKQLTKKQKELFNETYAYYFLQRKKYAAAIPHLQQALKSEDNSRQKLRLQYLLGQLYAETGQNAEAYNALEEMKGIGTPPYFTLQATIGQARSGLGEQQRKATLALEKMAKNAKYKDQFADLFQTLGDIYTSQNDTAKANRYYAEAKKINPGAPATHNLAPASETETATDTTALLAQQEEKPDLSQLAMFTAVARARNMRSAAYSPSELPETSPAAPDTVLFDSGTQKPYLFLATFPRNGVNKNKLLFAVANYNFSTFMLREFGLSFVNLQETEALQVKGFHSFSEAREYASMLFADSVFTAEAPQNLAPLIISEENMEILAHAKTINQYRAFYKVTFGETPLLATTQQAISEIDTIKVAPQPEEKAGFDTPETKIQAATPPQKQEVATTEKRLSVEEAQAQRQAELERKAQEALQKQPEKLDPKARQKLLKERERERQKLLKQRERERAALLKQREKEIKERQKQREKELKSRSKKR